MVVKRKRPSPLNLGSAQHCLEGIQSSPRMASFALSPSDKQHAIEQSKQIALRQRRLISSSTITPNDVYVNSGGSSAETSSSTAGFFNNSPSSTTSSGSCHKEENEKDSQFVVKDTSTEKVQDDTKFKAAAEHNSVKIPEIKTTQAAETNSTSEIDESENKAKKRPRRGEPPRPLHIPQRHKALLRQRQVVSAPINSADWQRSRRFLVNSAAQRLPPSLVPIMPFQGMGQQAMYALPALPIASGRASSSNIRVAGGFRSFGSGQMSQKRPYSMIPIVSAHPPVAVRGATSENCNSNSEAQDKNNTVDDVYAGSYRKKEQGKASAKSDHEQSETSSKKDEDEDDSDDLESRAIEEGAEAPQENLQGVIRIGERLYRYSVAVTGDKASDKKHFHDVMDVIWKNYAE